MTAMRISLRPGEKLYLNGAVLRVERKTSFTLLNDAVFLLDQHVMQAEEATTPLRQLYFIAQTMLMDPAGAGGCRQVFDESFHLLCETFEDRDVLTGMAAIGELMAADRVLVAMKAIRALTAIEDRILAGKSTTGAAA